MRSSPARGVPAVKICGLTRETDAAHAASAGAAYLGAILASGPRLLTPERARAVLGPRRPGIARVGVFGSQPEEELLALADAIDLDVLQLHGDRAPEAVARLSRRTSRALWPVLRIGGTTLPPEAFALAAITDVVVLDALVIGKLGGTGVALDWSGLAESVAALRVAHPRVQLVLGGGLTPHNVDVAIRVLAPEVVDVSSGVEIAPGVKDPALIDAFVRAARSAAERL